MKNKAKNNQTTQHFQMNNLIEPTRILKSKYQAKISLTNSKLKPNEPQQHPPLIPVSNNSTKLGFSPSQHQNSKFTTNPQKKPSPQQKLQHIQTNTKTKTINSQIPSKFHIKTKMNQSNQQYL